MMNDGIPIIYYGQEQDFSGAADPQNREALWPTAYNTGTDRYDLISQLNSIRKAAIEADSTYVTTTSTIVYSDNRAIALRKGAYDDAGTTSVFSNYGSGTNATLSLNSSATGWTKGTTFIDLLSCDEFTTDSSGTLSVTIVDGAPLVLYPTSGLSQTGLCTSAKAADSSTGSIASTISSSKSSTVSPSTSSSAVSSAGTVSSTMSSGMSSSTESTAKTTIKTTSRTTVCPTTSTSTDRSTATSQSTSTTGGPESAATTASTSQSTTATSSFVTSSCAVATSVAVLFYENKTTAWGQSVKLTGSISQLGSWDASNAVALSASDYSTASPIWNGNVTMPAGTTFEYKFILVDDSGDVSWESDPNRNYTVPTGCSTTASVNDTWR
ncbi:putative alpha-amylase [Teratosphaeria destructans]|uniref:Alpha-amylase n=1 Tax=Teratosphaeria destructans TaxID=418781 RepID=A0A9W7VZU3_9PEZI|nr:putative alpha-amylase [Teratosphaeria destructans]